MFGFAIFNEDWLDDAACGGTTESSVFHPYPTQSANKGKRVCATCDVRLDCLAYAIMNGEFSGTWGGMRDSERRDIFDTIRQGVQVDLATIPMQFDGLPEYADEPEPRSARRRKIAPPTKPRITTRTVVPAPPLTNPTPQVLTAPPALPTPPEPVVSSNPDVHTEMALLLAATDRHTDPTVRALRRVLVQSLNTLQSAVDMTLAEETSVA